MSPGALAVAQLSIANAFDSLLGKGSGLRPLLAGMVASRLYEARVLAEVLVLLAGDGYKFTVVNGTMGLKASPGPSNAAYAHIEISDAGKHVATLWTDVEFAGLGSQDLAGHASPVQTGEYHELDILVCRPGAASRPAFADVFIAVEAKHRAALPKGLLREALGVRRELSYCRTGMAAVTPPELPVSALRVPGRASPASYLVFAYSKVFKAKRGPMAEWSVPAAEFDIEMMHVPL